MAGNMAEGHDVLRGLLGDASYVWSGGGELQPASVVERGEWLAIRCASVSKCASLQVLL
jgi:hypothetical protein